MARSRPILESGLLGTSQARNDPGLESVTVRRVNNYTTHRLTCNNLGCFRFLILLENPDGGMLPKDRIFGDKDFLDLLLRRCVVHHV